MALIRCGAGGAGFEDGKFGLVSMAYDSQIRGNTQLLTPSNNVAIISASGSAVTPIFLFNAKAVTLSQSGLVNTAKGSNDGVTWQNMTISGSGAIDVSAYKYINIMAIAVASQNTITITW